MDRRLTRRPRIGEESPPFPARDSGEARQFQRNLAKDTEYVGLIGDWHSLRQAAKNLSDIGMNIKGEVEKLGKVLHEEWMQRARNPAMLVLPPEYEKHSHVVRTTKKNILKLAPHMRETVIEIHQALADQVENTKYKSKTLYRGGSKAADTTPPVHIQRRPYLDHLFKAVEEDQVQEMEHQKENELRDMLFIQGANRPPDPKPPVAPASPAAAPTVQHQNNLGHRRIRLPEISSIANLVNRPRPKVLEKKPSPGDVKGWGHTEKSTLKMSTYDINAYFKGGNVNPEPQEVNYANYIRNDNAEYVPLVSSMSCMENHKGHLHRPTQDLPNSRAPSREPCPKRPSKISLKFNINREQ